MSWQAIVTREAEEDLDRLDRLVRSRILEKLNWLRENFDDLLPLPLGGRWRGFFKLRVGDWRIIYEIESNKKLVIIHHVGPRDKIYRQK